MGNRRPYLFLFGLGALLLLSMLLLWPNASASAQCGSQASSCKACHETQGAKPVNADNTGWHTGHAFGDFCYSCHGGNNQSMVADEAHAGMTAPMADIQISCSGCHPDDLQERAQVYATALGISLEVGGTAGTTAAEPAAGPTPAAETGPAAPAEVVVQPATGAEIVVPVAAQDLDYVARYNGETAVNWGDVIVVVLIVVLLAGGGALVYWNERRLRGLPLFPARPAPAPAGAEAPLIPGYSAEVSELLPMLAHLNPVGLHALKRILHNPEQANEMLHSLSHLDPELVKRIRSMDKDSRALLLALAGD